jgi:hypothetical protein
MPHPNDDPNEVPNDPLDSTEPRFEREETRKRTLQDAIIGGFAHGVLGDSQPVSAEFSLENVVPRAEPSTYSYRSEDIYVRLENKIYGPMSRDRLNELLSSGLLTGFESASADLRHWTPLIYHPRMILTETVDPDATHDLLHSETDLPQTHARPRRIDLEKLGEDPSAALPEEEIPATPLAAMLIKPKRRTGDVVETSSTGRLDRRREDDLPVFADLELESLDDAAARAEQVPPAPPPVPDEARTSGRHRVVEQTPDPAEAAESLAEAGTIDWDALAGTPAGAEPGEQPVTGAPATPAPARSGSGHVVLWFMVLVTLTCLAGAVYFFVKLRQTDRPPTLEAPVAPATPGGGR